MNPDLLRMAGTVLASPALPGLASALAIGQMGASALGALKGAANPALGGAATYAQMQQPNPEELKKLLAQNPSLSAQVQALNRPTSLADVAVGTGATGRVAQGLEAQLQRNERVKDFMAYYPLTSQAHKDELDRQLAAAQVRQNIATNADLLQSGYHTAQQIGANAASQLGQALTAQYQYS